MNLPGHRVVPLLGPVRSGTALEETMARLMQLIRLGSVRAGERLPSERELAVQLGVSRTTLREAIAELQRAGYLEVRRGRYGGAYVCEPPVASGKQVAGQPDEDGSSTWPTAEELDDVLRFRTIVEVAAAGQAAAARLADRRVEALRQALAECAEADPATFRQMDSRLHLLIADCAGIPSLLRSVAEVRTRVNQLLDQIPLLQGNLDHSHEQHRRLIEAIIAGRVDQAEALAAEHAAGTETLLRGFLGERLKPSQASGVVPPAGSPSEIA